MSEWRWAIRAYKANGDLMMETRHKTEGSRDAEIGAFYERMRRGEVAYIEVVTLVPPYGVDRRY